jgi:hypothetical protein
MLHGINLQAAVDIGFVIFVVYACWKSLLANDNAGAEQRRKVWKREFSELEASLRELVGEATASSTNLDRTLFRRKQELERLLANINTAVSSGEMPQDVPSTGPATAIAPQQAAAAYRNQQPRQYTSSQQAGAELPNESWNEPFDVSKYAERPSVESAHTKTTGQNTAQPSPQQVAQQAVTPQSTFQQEQVEAVTPQLKYPPGQEAVSLAQSVEMINEAADSVEALQEEPAEDPIIEQFEHSAVLSGRDPIAYKVAKRLLQQDNEIHVVARKLGLPLAEVRMLDNLIRQATNGQSEEIPTHHVVRSQGANGSQGSISLLEPGDGEDLDTIIERERTLL